jgi:hypothetical protein
MRLAFPLKVSPACVKVASVALSSEALAAWKGLESICRKPKRNM